MDNLNDLEQRFKEFTTNLKSWIPDGIVSVDLELLHKHDLLNYHTVDSSTLGLSRYFQVIETYEKITLINDQFIVWIVPEYYKKGLVTYVLIALQDEKGSKLEMAFSTSGVYNNSKLVLRVLEKFLWEIQENNELMHHLNSNSKLN